MAKKAFRISNLILRAVCFPSIATYRKAFITYCRPLLEYATFVWSPCLQKLISLVENVQRRFSRRAYARCFPSKEIPCYSDRLALFDLKPLSHRRIYFDLVLCYKIIFSPNSHPELKGLFKISNHARRTRSHNFQITPFQSFHNRQLYHSFACRVPRIWNKLPCDIFSSLNYFKSSIYKLDLVALSILN